MNNVFRFYNQSPFRACGGSSSALEAIDATVELRVSEHRLDHRLAFPVERVTELGGEHSAHVRVGAAVPSRTGALALAGIRRDQYRDPVVDDVLHLLLVPVAGIGEQHSRRLGDTCRLKLALGCVEHRLEVTEVR